MGNGYPIVQPNELADLRALIQSAFTKIRELERPTGTQTYGAVAKVKEAIASIGTLVDAYLATGFTTGTIHATGRVTADGGVTSADVKARTLSVGYDSVYIDVNNIMGKAPSARRLKQDFENYNFDPSVVDRMQGRTFRIIAAVEEMGDDAPVEVGWIADDLAELGLTMFVRYDPDGQISGLAYERIVMVAIDALKDARREIAGLKADVETIKRHLGI